MLLCTHSEGINIMVNNTIEILAYTHFIKMKSEVSIQRYLALISLTVHYHRSWETFCHQH